jgi:hypothetical protein
VRELLYYAYTKLNVRYMALSREMEYHADLVACSVAGTQPMISTLRRIEFTDNSYNFMLNHLNQLVTQKKKVSNLYPVHQLTTGFLARQFNLTMINNLPDITEQDLEKNLVKSRVNLKDQWASHPSREERELNINSLNLPVTTIGESAWHIFGRSQECQKQMTAHLYTVGSVNLDEITEISEADFMRYVEDEKKKFDLPEIFKGFYDQRLIHEFDVTEVSQQQPDQVFDELFNDSNREFFIRQAADKNDLEQVKAIWKSVGKNEYLEFDYQKRKVAEIPSIIAQLEADIKASQEKGTALDKQAFQFFLTRSQNNGTAAQLIAGYTQLFEWQYAVKECGEVVEQLQQYHQELATKLQWSEVEGNRLIRDLHQLETKFKLFLKTMPASATEMMPDREEFEKNYVDGVLQHMSSHMFNEVGLEKLTERIYEIFNIIHQKRFDTLKAITELQCQHA